MTTLAFKSSALPNPLMMSLATPPQIAAQLVRQEVVSSTKVLQVKRHARGWDQTAWSQEEEARLREVWQSSLEHKEAVKMAAEHFPGYVPRPLDGCWLALL